MSAVLVIELPTVVPVQQGSKTMIGIGRPCYACKRKRMIIVDAADVSNKTDRDRLKKYREHVAAVARKEAQAIGWKMLEGGVDLEVTILYQRPDGHLKKNRSLRKGRPVHKQSKPDLDKLLRAINDALAMAEIFKDDSQVVNVAIHKRYAKDGEVHGALIVVRETPLGLAGLFQDGP